MNAKHIDPNQFALAHSLIRAADPTVQSHLSETLVNAINHLLIGEAGSIRQGLLIEDDVCISVAHFNQIDDDDHNTFVAHLAAARGQFIDNFSKVFKD